MIQPLIGTPGAQAAKLAVHRELWLHPDKVSFRSSPKLLHRLSLDWENPASPSVLKAGTIIALRRVRSTDAISYWMPWVLTTNHLSYAGGGGPYYILLPASFQPYASNLFPAGARFTRVTLGSTGNVDFVNISSTDNATTATVGGVNYVAIPVSSITNNWADNSVLLYHGVGVGPTGAENVFSFVEAVSIIPANTLVTDNQHTQLHHFPWSGIVLGNMLYPPSQVSGQASARNRVLKHLLREASSRGYTGILLDEVN